MNIFYLHEDLELCVQMYFDRHICKLICEYVQILCSVYWVLHPKVAQLLLDNQKFYKKTHINHPSCRWVRESRKNFEFLIALTQALHSEYQFRYKTTKIHSSMKKLQVIIRFPPKSLPDIPMTPLLLVMPEEFKQKNVIQAYRNYYMSKQKEHLRQWKNRPIPDFFTN